MKINKRYIGIALFVLLAWFGKAQNTGFYWNQLNDSSNRLQGKLMGQVYFITAIANSNFLYPEEWLDGTVTLVDGDTYKNMKLRLHVFQDELIAYNQNNNTLYFVQKELVQSFTFKKDGVQQQFLKLSPKKGSDKSQYFEELYSGTIKLLVFRYIYEHKVSPFIDKLGVMRDSEYRMHTEYYYLSANENSIKKILPKRKAIINAFPKHKKEIKKLFRQQHIFIDNKLSMFKAIRLLDEAGLLQ